jgi:hypothetical protein
MDVLSRTGAAKKRATEHSVHSRVEDEEQSRGNDFVSKNGSDTESDSEPGFFWSKKVPKGKGKRAKSGSSFYGSFAFIIFFLALGALLSLTHLALFGIQEDSPDTLYMKKVMQFSLRTFFLARILPFSYSKSSCFCVPSVLYAWRHKMLLYDACYR